MSATEARAECSFYRGLDGHRGCVTHSWEGYVENIRRVRVCPAALAALPDDGLVDRRELLAKVEGLSNRHPEIVGGRTGYGHRGFEEARAAVIALLDPSR